MARTAASTTVRMNTERTVSDSRRTKTRNNPILKYRPWASRGFQAVNPVSYCMGRTSYFSIRGRKTDMLVDRGWNVCLLSSQTWMQEKGGAGAVWWAVQICGRKPTDMFISGASHKMAACPPGQARNRRRELDTGHHHKELWYV